MPIEPLLAIHGGAGTIGQGRMTPDQAEAYRAGLAASLRAGYRVLSRGGPALEAVTAAVIVLEDDPLFNAGRGSVLTTDGLPEMDAAIMNGADRAAGAVAGICGPRNPILAARAVLEHSGHVLLIGAGAERFARERGLAFESPAYFVTERRVEALQAELHRRRSGGPDLRDDAARHGTVGAVARDARGHLAAATSTGGLTAKRPGRVGDTPLFGAGTWADELCAVSATGHGEMFVRWAVAHEITSRIRHRGDSIAGAGENVIAELGTHGGSGGVIAVDRSGDITMPFNSEGMYRGTIGPDGIARTAIYAEALSPAA